MIDDFEKNLKIKDRHDLSFVDNYINLINEKNQGVLDKLDKIKSINDDSDNSLNDVRDDYNYAIKKFKHAEDKKKSDINIKKSRKFKKKMNSNKDQNKVKSEHANIQALKFSDNYLNYDEKSNSNSSYKKDYYNSIEIKNDDLVVSNDDNADKDMYDIGNTNAADYILNEYYYLEKCKEREEKLRAITKDFEDFQKEEKNGKSFYLNLSYVYYNNK